eukprot:16441551-Heterocapsa_arctica.AAC.2
MPPAEGQILAYMAFCESSQDQSPGNTASKGELGFKGLISSCPAEKTKKPAAEIVNGRIAIIAIIGILFRIVTPAPPGVTRPCTSPRRCARSITSSAGRRRLATGS